MTCVLCPSPFQSAPLTVEQSVVTDHCDFVGDPRRALYLVSETRHNYTTRWYSCPILALLMVFSVLYAAVMMFFSFG